MPGMARWGHSKRYPIDALRRQFETNVVGALRLCQLVLPGMRRRGYGRIVNVSTMGGVMSMLGGGAYYASKHALEALSDALRAEVAPSGAAVVVIQTGPVWSGFNGAARASAALAPNGGPYDALKHALVTRAIGEAVTIPRELGATPEQVAAVIVQAVATRHPKTRYRVTMMARLLPAARRLLPDRGWDALTRRMLGLH